MEENKYISPEVEVLDVYAEGVLPSTYLHKKLFY